MNIRLDKNSPIPVGGQIKAQIKMLIDYGEYKRGEKLPSIKQLADLLGVNKNTIVSIYKELENEGYVESQRGKGIFVESKRQNNLIDSKLLDNIDTLINEARKKGISSSELVNLIGARYFHVPLTGRKIRALFLMGINQELVDVNIHKLKQNIPGVEFDGLLLDKDLTREKVDEAFRHTDLFIVPAIFYENAKELLPRDKPIVKTIGNLKTLRSLRKGIEKKSRIAVMGATQDGAQKLASMFISSGLFKPRLVLTMNEIDKYKKELKDIATFVVCLSAREVVEKLKLKDKDIYFFSDYINDDSIEEIRLLLKGIK